MSKVYGLRGATTVTENSAAAIQDAVAELLRKLQRENAFQPEDICVALFSATPDITALFPATAARTILHWDMVPLFDVRQPDVIGALPYCIRVLLLINGNESKVAQHVYLRGARKLRPDLSKVD